MNANRKRACCPECYGKKKKISPKKPEKTKEEKK